MLISLNDPHTVRFKFRTHSLPSSYMVYVCVSFGTRPYHSIAHLRPTESMLVALDILEMLDLLNLLDMLDIYHGWSFKSLRFEREVGLLIHCLTAKKTAACLPYPEPLQTQEIERFSSCGILRQNKTLLFTTTT